MTPRSLIAAAIIAATVPLLAAQEQSRLSADIIDTYSRMIADNPESCDLRLSRATEYASQSLLSLALTDLNDAMRLAPGNDKGVRFEILTRRAGVYERLMDYEPALADITAASGLYPDVPSLKLSQGRLLKALGRYAEARDAFNSYRRTDPRSTDALFGLAEVAALEGDSNTALGYADDALQAAGGNGDSHIRRAGIFTILGRPGEAVAEYIAAIGCGDESSGNALQRLADMSYDDYPTVIKGFDEALAKAPSSGQLYYLRATIAQAHEHHREAMADIETIDGTGPFANGALGEMAAESLYALSLPADALLKLDGVPTPLRGASYFTLRSKVLASLGRGDEALADARRAVEMQGEDIPALEQLARMLVAQGMTDEAAATLAEAMMTAREPAPALYFLRAALVSGPQRERLMEEAAELPYSSADPASLKGFALLALNRPEEAEIWANAIMRHDTAHDGVADYTAACVLARAGKNADALRALATAVARGFSNKYLINADTTPGMSLEPLRGDAEFPK